MTSAIQIRRDTAAQIATKTPLQGELAYAIDTKRLSIGDGVTAGGIPLAKESEAGIVATVAASAKTTPVDADLVGIADSADSNSLKKLTFANLATWIGTKLGAIYVALSGKTTPVDADVLPIGDSEASNATKKLTWANLKATLKAYFDTLYQPLSTALTNFSSLVGNVVSGDIIYGSGTATLARLAKGSNGTVLTLSGGLPSWQAPASAAGTARNRIVNPAMQISSINGNTSGTSSGYAPADNWLKYHVSSAGTLTVQRVQSVTPKGAKDRIRVTITAADASLAAGEYLTLTQNIAGQEVADFQYGTANAKQVLLRFLFKGPQGTYAIALHNAAQNRSYVATFTISAGQANTDTIQEITIAGDTTGTWTTDSTTGLTLDIVLACGSTFQGTTGWQSGNIMGTSSVSNGMATISSVFEIGEVGMYLDVNATGSFPTWELPSYRADSGPGLVFIPELSGRITSPAAVLDIVLANHTQYRDFRIHLRNFIPVSAGVDFWMRFSTNGGSSFDSGASDYAYSKTLGTGGGLSASYSTGAAQIQLTNNHGSTSFGSVHTIDLLDPFNTAAYTKALWTAYLRDNVPNIYIYDGGGNRNTNQDTDAVRFLFASGNISSGSYEVYGYV